MAGNIAEKFIEESRPQVKSIEEAVCKIKTLDVRGYVTVVGTINDDGSYNRLLRYVKELKKRKIDVGENARNKYGFFVDCDSRFARLVVYRRAE